MKHILITGGTGTLGSLLAEKLLPNNHVTVLSRDEKKLSELRKKLPKVKIAIGNVREEMYGFGYDTIFHCAALKHVDIGEEFPHEFAKTNYHGTINTWKLAQACRCKDLIFFSTDKAVLPINAYGYSKAMAEKFLLSTGTPVKIYRWGNIIGSRGSVIPHFVDCIKASKPCVITDERMTRFWLTIDEAIGFVLATYDLPMGKFDPTQFHDEPPHNYDLQNPIIHPNIKSASVVEIVDALGEVMGIKPIIKFGQIRPGEKIHECLRTGHDYCIRSDNCDRYSRAELIEKLTKYIESTK